MAGHCEWNALPSAIENITEISAFNYSTNKTHQLRFCQFRRFWHSTVYPSNFVKRTVPRAVWKEYQLQSNWPTKKQHLWEGWRNLYLICFKLLYYLQIWNYYVLERSSCDGFVLLLRHMSADNFASFFSKRRSTNSCNNEYCIPSSHCGSCIERASDVYIYEGLHQQMKSVGSFSIHRTYNAPWTRFRLGCLKSVSLISSHSWLIYLTEPFPQREKCHEHWRQ